MAAVLIVDSDLTLASALARELTRSLAMFTTEARALVEVTPEAEFSRARARLKASPPELLVSALQLREYNGLHLVHIVAGLPTRCVVHTDELDAGHAREVRASGAFYEIRSRLSAMLPAYLTARLPASDRRDPSRFDRRRLARGGRRAADPHPAAL